MGIAGELYSLKIHARKNNPPGFQNATKDKPRHFQRFFVAFLGQTFYNFNLAEIRETKLPRQFCKIDSM